MRGYIVHYEEDAFGGKLHITSHIGAAVSLFINGFFIYNIIRHMIRPGGNVGYTRMLMFVGLATIPMVFLMGLAGGRDRWPFLLDIAKEVVGSGPFQLPGVVGLAAVVIVLPLAVFAAIWIMMELRSGLLFILYFVPLFLRMALEPASECIKTVIIQVLVFFGSIFIVLGIVYFLKRHGTGVEKYAEHVQIIWADYDIESSVNMFFWVHMFALINQLIEFGRVLSVLLHKN